MDERRKQILAQLLVGALPGAGEAMAAQESVQAGGDAAASLRQGDYGGAASGYLNATVAGLGAVPVLGAVPRLSKRGMQALVEALRAERAERVIDVSGKASNAAGMTGTVPGLFGYGQ